MIPEIEVPDALYVVSRLKMLIKRTNNSQTCGDRLAAIITVPLAFLQNYTIPMADFADWDRTRASILPLTVPVGYSLLGHF
jgi:hypothetical protein